MGQRQFCLLGRIERLPVVRGTFGLLGIIFPGWEWRGKIHTRAVATVLTPCAGIVRVVSLTRGGLCLFMSPGPKSVRGGGQISRRYVVYANSDESKEARKIIRKSDSVT